LAKAADVDAVVMAAAALVRLGREAAIAEVLDPLVLLPQVAQGALAVECRADDAAMLERLRAIEHAPSRVAVDAERAFLAELGGACDLPVGALASVDGDSITIEGLMASFDGRVCVRETLTGDDPVALGRALAVTLMSKLES
jgi:hydroxymethylbilane synthase